jgi:uncharacterized membrane protein YhaH (DUF805 family)
MEDNELQKLWGKVDSQINRKSKDEMELLLTSKAKQIINKVVITSIIAIPTCIAMIIWLIITSANRLHDTAYLVNNALLGIIILLLFFYGLRFWQKFRHNKYSQPVTTWLKKRIDLLSRGLTGRFSRLEYYLFPLLYIMTFLSIHVFYAEMDLTDVFKSKKFLSEDIWGIIIFTPLLLAGGYSMMIKIRKYHIRKLEFLKKLHERLCSELP